MEKTYIYVIQDADTGWYQKKNVTNKRYWRSDCKYEDYYTPVLGKARIFFSESIAKTNRFSIGKRDRIVEVECNPARWIIL